MKAYIRPDEQPCDYIVELPAPTDREVPPLDWPDPESLPESRPPVQAFNPALLPTALRGWIEDVAERMQCPIDFPAVGAIVALSSVLGRHVGIRPKRQDDWLVVTNLWGAIVGRPGIMKTPALTEALRPLRRLAAEEQRTYRDALVSWESEKEVFAAKRTALKKKMRESAACKEDSEPLESLLTEMQLLGDAEGQRKPHERRYSTNDSTVEKLGELLADNPNGLLVFRDELSGWLKSMDRDGHESDRSFYLEAWAGNGDFTYDRIGRGTIQIEAACVSVLGGIQPGPLSEYVVSASRNGRGADGLLQRFQLLVYPDDPHDWRDVDRWPDSRAKDRAFEIFDRLAVLDLEKTGVFDNVGTLANNATLEDYVQGISEPGGIPSLQFDPEAQEVFAEWRGVHERTKLRAGEPEIIEAHLAKYRKLVPALALIGHLADSGTGLITKAAVQRAVGWAEYLETHARRVYALAATPKLPAAHTLASHIRARDLPDPFTARDVYRREWRLLNTETTGAALRLLEEFGWLFAEKPKTGGRPTVLFHINPKLFGAS